jgi:hypothetical protein
LKISFITWLKFSSLNLSRSKLNSWKNKGLDNTKGKIIKIRLLDSMLMLDGSLFGNSKLLLKLNSSLKVYFYLNY